MIQTDLLKLIKVKISTFVCLVETVGIRKYVLIDSGRDSFRMCSFVSYVFAVIEEHSLVSHPWMYVTDRMSLK